MQTAAEILAVGRALPRHYYDQEILLAGFRTLWADRFFNPARLEQIHRNVLVGGRHLALPMEEYADLQSFGEANGKFIECAVDLGEQAIRDGLEKAELTLEALDHLFFVSVTGIATPSIDARLVNRLGLRRDVKRTPIFGLGCVAGAAGIARASDYLRAFPDQIAVLLSVELCSLTLQREDVSIANVISGGLFGDGAAAVVLAGAERTPARARPGPTVLATRSVFYPDTEELMGWEIGEKGFRVILSADVPGVITRYLRGDVEDFLEEQGLALQQIASFVSHPGGPRVLTALAESLELPQTALEASWRSLHELGNLSSASVLMVLADTLANHRPEPGSLGLLLALGPGFCAELVLLRW